MYGGKESKITIKIEQKNNSNNKSDTNIISY